MALGVTHAHNGVSIGTPSTPEFENHLLTPLAQVLDNCQFQSPAGRSMQVRVINPPLFPRHEAGCHGAWVVLPK